MQFIKKFIQKYLSRDMDAFSRVLGYNAWNEAEQNTFHIFFSPSDLEWSVTKLKDNTWAVWNDEGHPPFSFQVCSTWNEAIRYLRSIFEESNIPEEYWDPEGYDFEDDPFLILPDKSKGIKD
ncbi:TPA: hypothetical protein ROX88_001028 [Bacillus pseudomycoides]|nr:hypothetical protein [Bacillus pseudomycoides]